MDAQTWNELAWGFLRSGQADLALEHARRAHEMSRSNVEYLNTLGVAYGETGQLELAEATFRKALKRKPAFVDALVNLAKSLEKQEKLPEARKLFERALAIDPGFPKLAANLAKIHRDCGETERARSLLERSKNNIDAQDLVMALAECEFDLGNKDRALEHLRVAVSEHADWKLARNSFAHMLLSTAHWREGWIEYVGRRNLFDPRPTQIPAPLPLRLEGRHILLRGEQGIGDVLFFLRFAPLLSERGARLSSARTPSLRRFARRARKTQPIHNSITDSGLATFPHSSMPCRRRRHGVLSSMKGTSGLPDSGSRHWAPRLTLQLHGARAPIPRVGASSVSNAPHSRNQFRRRCSARHCAAGRAR